MQGVIHTKSKQMWTLFWRYRFLWEPKFIATETRCSLVEMKPEWRIGLAWKTHCFWSLCSKYSCNSSDGLLVHGKISLLVKVSSTCQRDYIWYSSNVLCMLQTISAICVTTTNMYVILKHFFRQSSTPPPLYSTTSIVSLMTNCNAVNILLPNSAFVPLTISR